MLIEMDALQVKVLAKSALQRIYDTRQLERDQYVQSIIDNRQRWHDRFKKVGLGWLMVPINKEYVVESIKNSRGFEYIGYHFIDMTHGRQEQVLKRIIKAIQVSKVRVVKLNEEDIWAL